MAAARSLSTFQTLTYIHCFTGPFPGKLVLSEPTRFLISNHPYPEHPHKTGQNSSYPVVLQTVKKPHPLTLTVIPRGVEAEVFAGWLPFLSPNQQYQSTEGKNIFDNLV